MTMPIGSEGLTTSLLLVVLTVALPIIGFFFVRTLKMIDSNQAETSKTVSTIVEQLAYLKGEHEFCKSFVVKKARRK